MEVAVIGVGQTPYVEERRDVSLQDLIFEAARLALSDAGIEREALDSIVIGSQDVVDGRGISNMSNAGAAGADMKDEIRVADDGIYALLLAALQIEAGRSSLALVISWSMGSEANSEAVAAVELDPFFSRPLGIGEAQTLALQATALSLIQPDVRHAASLCVMRDRESAMRNELAQLRAPVSQREVEESPVLSWPVRALDGCPTTDGACALVLASSDRAKGLAQDIAWIKGIGWASDTNRLGDRDLSRSASLGLAARKAYASAAIESPLDIGVIEVTAKSSFQELVILEALGLSEPGKSARKVLEWSEDWHRSPRINPSGGARSSCPAASVGLVRAAEGALQVSGRAGSHQVDKDHTALCHGTSGPCLQSNAVVVMGRSRS